MAKENGPLGEVEPTPNGAEASPDTGADAGDGSGEQQQPRRAWAGEGRDWADARRSGHGLPGRAQARPTTAEGHGRRASLPGYSSHLAVKLLRSAFCLRCGASARDHRRAAVRASAPCDSRMAVGDMPPGVRIRIRNAGLRTVGGSWTPRHIERLEELRAAVEEEVKARSIVRFSRGLAFGALVQQRPDERSHEPFCP